jgi:hypothetical protein
MKIRSFLSWLSLSPIPRLAIVAILLSTAVSQGGDSKERGFAIDPKRPYIDIVFNKIEERQPVFSSESKQGLWLSLRNNCTYTIKVHILNASNKNPGMLLIHDVFSTMGWMDSPPGSLSENEAIAQPRGYRGIDVVNSVEVLPSHELLFSVPLEHVTRNWAIRVEVYLKIPGPTYGFQPRTLVEYRFEYLPDKAKSLSDKMLAGGLH